MLSDLMDNVFFDKKLISTAGKQPDEMSDGIRPNGQ